MALFNSSRLRERRQGLEALNELLKGKSRCNVIHYSCESFVTNHGKTPRVTSICVMNLKSGQTKSFSIHLQAQIMGLDFNNLGDEQYDELEKNMLDDFSLYVTQNPTHGWVHWKMRDSNYGFEAINNRIKILKGTTFQIPDDFKYDFPKILELLYTYDYELTKPNGRLLNLAKRNNISTFNAMTGKEEADAFDNKEYLKLHMSTLKKVDIIKSIIQRIENNQLKVNTKKRHIYGVSFSGIIAIIKETPSLWIIMSIIIYIISSVLEPVFQKIFGTG